MSAEKRDLIFGYLRFSDSDADFAGINHDPQEVISHS